MHVLKLLKHEVMSSKGYHAHRFYTICFFVATVFFMMVPTSFQLSSPIEASSSLSSKHSSISPDPKNHPTSSQKHNYEFHVAPMQCYTNLSLRKMFKILTPSSILWTEMEKVNHILDQGIRNGDDETSSLRHAWSKRLGLPDSDSHSNLILQLGCNNPTELKSCITQTLPDYNTLKGINLNCGCPSIESGGSSYYGASLMKEKDLTYQLVHSMKEAAVSCHQDDLQISVKCRAGIFETFEDMRPLADKDYNDLYDYISTIQNAGANHVIIHARPAILSGLSPVKNRIVPELNYDIVKDVAKDFPDLRITLNGGIVGFDSLKELMKETEDEDNYISSHMSGRWCLRRPLDLIHIESLISNKEYENDHHDVPSVANALEEYLSFALNEINIPAKQREIPTDEICLPLYLVYEQLKEDFKYDKNEVDDKDRASTMCGPLLTNNEIDDALDVLSSGIVEIQSCTKKAGSSNPASSGSAATNMSFNQMSKCFNSIVGKKVVNKWSRNRAEL